MYALHHYRLKSCHWKGANFGNRYIYHGCVSNLMQFLQAMVLTAYPPTELNMLIYCPSVIICTFLYALN